MTFEEDRVVAEGLFYCLPWMRQARARIRNLEAALKMHGGHTANCAYLQGHFKGPSSECDCGWIQLIPMVHGSANNTSSVEK